MTSAEATALGFDAPVVLRARGLCKAYTDGGVSRAVIEELELTVQAGEVLVLWGPSGSGKSTLLNILAGVVAADRGELELLVDAQKKPLLYGQKNLKQTAQLRRRHLGYVFQFFNLIPTLTVTENIELAVQLAEGGNHKAEDLRADALTLLTQLGLAHRAQAFPDQLSGGEQQRAAIVRALAHRPQLLLADEPTGNLDFANAEQVVEALLAEARQRRCALVVATHDATIAERADRVLTLPC